MILEQTFYVCVCNYKIKVEKDIYEKLRERSINFREPFTEEVKWEYSFKNESEQTYEIHILGFPKLSDENAIRMILKTGVYRK